MKTIITLVLLTVSIIAHALTPKVTMNFEQKPTAGMSSWYGTFHHGRRTASGERFNRDSYTCASRTYRLGTKLLVRFPTKGTFVVVTVTDRGPYHHPDRVLDLSERAAKILGLRPYGIGFVEITPLHILGGM